MDTWTRNIIAKPSKIYSSETVGGQNAETTKRGSHRTDQVHRTDARRTRIHGIHRCIRGRLRSSVDGGYSGP